MSRCQKSSPGTASFLLPQEACCLSGQPGWASRSDPTKHPGHGTDCSLWGARLWPLPKKQRSNSLGCFTCSKAPVDSLERCRSNCQIFIQDVGNSSFSAGDQEHESPGTKSMEVQGWAHGLCSSRTGFPCVWQAPSAMGLLITGVLQLATTNDRTPGSTLLVFQSFHLTIDKGPQPYWYQFNSVPEIPEYIL